MSASSSGLLRAMRTGRPRRIPTLLIRPRDAAHPTAAARDGLTTRVVLGSSRAVSLRRRPRRRLEMAEHRFHTPGPVELDGRDPGRRHPGRDGRRRRVDRRASRATRSSSSRPRFELDGQPARRRAQRQEAVRHHDLDRRFQLRHERTEHSPSAIPHSSAAALATASADMKLRGRYAALEAKSASGDLSRSTARSRATPRSRPSAATSASARSAASCACRPCPATSLPPRSAATSSAKSVSGDVRIDSVREGTRDRAVASRATSSSASLPARTSTSTPAPCRATSVSEVALGSDSGNVRSTAARRSSCAARPSAATSASSARRERRCSAAATFACCSAGRRCRCSATGR